MVVSSAWSYRSPHHYDRLLAAEHLRSGSWQLVFFFTVYPSLLLGDVMLFFSARVLVRSDKERSAYPSSHTSRSLVSTGSRQLVRASRSHPYSRMPKYQGPLESSTTSKFHTRHSGRISLAAWETKIVGSPYKSCSKLNTIRHTQGCTIVAEGVEESCVWSPLGTKAIKVALVDRNPL